MLKAILRFVERLVDGYRIRKWKSGRLKHCDDTMSDLHRQSKILMAKLAQCGAKIQTIRPAGVRDPEDLAMFKYEVHKEVRNAQEIYRQVVALDVQYQSLKAEEIKLRREMGV